MTELRCDAASAATLDTVESRQSVFGGLARTAASVFSLLRAWQARASERHHLAGLDDRLLEDAGISHADAAEELRKPFWRP